MKETIELPSATLSWGSPNEIEIRFTSGIRLDKRAIAEVIATRKRMQGGLPIGLLLIIPVDTELDVMIINTDHLKVHDATDQVLAFAVVAPSAISEVMLRLYKAYYPTLFRAEVFTDEVEARIWLREQVALALEDPKRRTA